MNPGEFRDRLETIDERGKRIWVYADIVKGAWRKRRSFVAYILVFVYIAIPWLQIDSNPFLRFDFLNHTFWIFGHSIGFHQTPIILSIVMGSIFMILAITALAGRAWCGWACPQTVFLEFIYRPIEKMIEGYSGDRRKLDQAPWTENKIQKKILKFLIFGFISFVIANTFVAYIVGGPQLLHLMSSPPSDNPLFFILMTLIFAAFMFNFGWFREQMCTITCPYGRFQSVLLDKNSKIIAYDSKRGEPRGKNGSGDCVDCHRCVQVCPTGIDIRNGLQLECVNCAACIDACNIVMSKIGKKENLIKYTTENLNLGIKAPKTYFLRPVVYFLFSISLFAYANKVFIHPTIEVTVLRKTTDPQLQNNNIVINQLSFRIENESNKEITVTITAENADTLLVTAQNPLLLAAREKRVVQIFAETPINVFNNKHIERNISFNFDKLKIVKQITLFPAGGGH